MSNKGLHSARLASPQDVAAFRAWMAATLGLRFDDNKDAWLADVITRRAQANGKIEVPAYLARLGALALPDELAELAGELTVPETSFFRNIEQFQVFKDVVLPQRCKANAATKQLRVLSAACATGEEAYSIAITLSELAFKEGWQVQIDALDLNPAVLAAARRGRYSDWSLRETPDELRRRWFTQDGRFNVLDERIRDMVRFEVRNLVADAPSFWTPARYDLIFCRNVLMYFTPEQTRAVVGRLASALLPGGYLFIGYAETLRGMSTEFELHQTHGTYYYQRLDPSRAPVPAPPHAASKHGKPATYREHGRGKHGPHAGGKPLVREADTAMTESPGATAQERSQAGHSMSGVGLGAMSIHLAQAHDMFALERFDDAWALMQSSPEHQKGAPQAKRLHVMLLVQQGLLSQARDICHQMAGHGEMPADAHHMLALCQAGAGDLQGALSSERTAAKIDPAFAMPHLQSGLMSRRHGDTRAGRRELEVAMHLLHREEDARVSLFGGGFSRHALLSLCRAELSACGAA